MPAVRRPGAPPPGLCLSLGAWPVDSGEGLMRRGRPAPTRARRVSASQVLPAPGFAAIHPPTRALASPCYRPALRWDLLITYPNVFRGETSRPARSARCPWSAVRRRHRPGHPGRARILPGAGTNRSFGRQLREIGSISYLNV